jgi:hypothetical protein
VLWLSRFEIYGQYSSFTLILVVAVIVFVVNSITGRRTV